MDPHSMIDPAFLAQSRAENILIGSILPPAIATVFVFARLYSRGILLRNWGYDDTWILISWILGSVGLTVLNCLLVKYGGGQHVEAPINQRPNTIDINQKLAFASRVIYQLSLMTTKIAICEFYRRIFTDRRSRIFVWSMVAAVVAYSIPLTVAVVFQCSQVPGHWQVVKPGRCIDTKPSVYAVAILNVITDVILLAFVFPKILALRIAKKQKASLLVIVSLSVLAIVAGIVRLSRSLSLYISRDPPWDSYDISIWSSIEVNTGLFCASAAAIKPVLRKISPSIFSSSALSHASPSGPNSRHKLDMYGRSKSRSTADAIALGSQAELDSATNKVWADGHSDTSEGALEMETFQRSDIKKNVDISITYMEAGKAATSK